MQLQGLFEDRVALEHGLKGSKQLRARAMHLRLISCFGDGTRDRLRFVSRQSEPPALVKEVLSSLVILVPDPTIPLIIDLIDCLKELRGEFLTLLLPRIVSEDSFRPVDPSMSKGVATFDRSSAVSLEAISGVYHNCAAEF